MLLLNVALIEMESPRKQILQIIQSLCCGACNEKQDANAGNIFPAAAS